MDKYPTTAEAPDSELTEKELRFCHAYLIEPSPGHAARVAGYKPSASARAGHRLLTRPQVRKKIDELRADREQRLNISADRVITELATMAFGDPIELGPKICPPEIAELPEKVRRRITDWSRNEDGTLTVREQKTKSLELIGRHFGLFVDRMEVKVSSLEDVLAKSVEMEGTVVDVTPDKKEDE